MKTLTMVVLEVVLEVVAHQHQTADKVIEDHLEMIKL
jgi:hypothetical protein